MKLSPNIAVLILAVVVTLSTTVSCTQVQKLGKSQSHQDRLHGIFNSLDPKAQSFGNPNDISVHDMFHSRVEDTYTLENRRQRSDQLQATLSRLDNSKKSADLDVVRTLVDLALVAESDADRSAYCNRAISIAERAAIDDPSKDDAEKMLFEISQIRAAGIVPQFEDRAHPHKMVTVFSPENLLYCRAELALKSEGLTWSSLGTLFTLCRYLLANGKNSEACDVCTWVDEYAARVASVHPELLEDPITKVQRDIANEFSRGPAGVPLPPKPNFLHTLRGFGAVMIRESGGKERAKAASDQLERDERAAAAARLRVAESAVAKARNEHKSDPTDLAEALMADAFYCLLSGDKSKALSLNDEAVNIYSNLRRTPSDTKLEQLLFDFAAICVKQLDAATGTAVMYSFLDAVERRAAGGVPIYPNRVPQFLAYFDRRRDEQTSTGLVEHVVETRKRLRPNDEAGLAELTEYQKNLRSRHLAVL